MTKDHPARQDEVYYNETFLRKSDKTPHIMP